MHYDYLIIGGGVLGQAVAWQLGRLLQGHARLGLVTAEGLSNGTTAQAAALVTQGRSSVVASNLVQDTLSAVAELNDQLELGVPFHRSGGLHIAMSQSEHAALQTMAIAADEAGAEYEWLDQHEAQLKAPDFDLTGFYSALWFEADGYIDPVLLANAYGESAKANGVKFHTNSLVDKLLVASDASSSDHVSGVQLTSGECIHAHHIILCAGPWAAKLLKPLGCSVPVSPVRSLYWMTESLPKKPRLPVTIVPSVRSYFRRENQSVLFGVRDCPGQSLHPDNIPADVLGFEFPEDSQGLEALMDTWPQLVSFWPDIERLGLAHFISGISSYSLDGLPVIGDPFFNGNSFIGLTVVTGCSGAGVAYSAGIAKLAVDHAQGKTSLNPLSGQRFTHQECYQRSSRESLSYESHSRVALEQIKDPLSIPLCAYSADFRRECLQARYNKKAG